MAQSRRSRLQKLLESYARGILRLIFIVVFRIRCFGRENFPVEGGALICSNHQSYLDPVLVGMTCNRPMNYIARKTLFRFQPFAKLIGFWDAIPIDQQGSGLAGIKESLRRLRSGELVLIFPEGTRTRDGEVQALKPGVLALARRGKVPIVPVAFDGALDAWPRSRKIPRRSVIHLCVGRPISREQIESQSDEQLLAEVEHRIRECLAKARKGRNGQLAMGHCNS